MYSFFALFETLFSYQEAKNLLKSISIMGRTICSCGPENPENIKMILKTGWNEMNRQKEMTRQIVREVIVQRYQI